jgi:flagellum-specific peptidoglycan hydrolase FlgJ
MTKEQFVSMLQEPVKAISIANGIPYEFMMAQMALETGWGASSLFYEHFNVGGIKAYGSVASVPEWTWEDVNTTDLDKYPSRDKTKDKALPNNKTAIYLQLPFASFTNLKDGLQYYLDKVLLNVYFKKYVALCGGDAIKYVQLLQSGTPKYATDVNYVPKITALINQFKQPTA